MCFFFFDMYLIQPIVTWKRELRFACVECRYILGVSPQLLAGTMNSKIELPSLRQGEEPYLVRNYFDCLSLFIVFATFFGIKHAFFH